MSAAKPRHGLPVRRFVIAGNAASAPLARPIGLVIPDRSTLAASPRRPDGWRCAKRLPRRAPRRRPAPHIPPNPSKMETH